MKYLKTFENYDQNINEEIFGMKSADEKAYKRTTEFLEGDSEEAKKVKEIYKSMKESGKANDTNIWKQITLLGSQWASKNKMEAKDYAFSQIRTVLEKEFDRFFKGGSNPQAS